MTYIANSFRTNSFARTRRCLATGKQTRARSVFCWCHGMHPHLPFQRYICSLAKCPGLFLYVLKDGEQERTFGRLKQVAGIWLECSTPVLLTLRNPPYRQLLLVSFIWMTSRTTLISIWSINKNNFGKMVSWEIVSSMNLCSKKAQKTFGTT